MIQLNCRLILFYILTLLFNCCSTGISNQDILDEAEAIIEEYPDSAATLLCDVNQKHINNSDKAKYALLYTQARYKNYFDDYDDSLINIAVEYYRTDNDDKRLMKSLFYQSMIYSNCRQYDNSIISLMDAENIAKSLKNDYYLGMIYRQMAIIYASNYNMDKELEYCKLAYEAFGRSKHTVHQIYAYLALANAYSDTKHYAVADSIYKDILQSHENQSDENLISQCCIAYSYQLMDLNQYDKAKDYILDAKTSANYQLQAIDYNNLSTIYATELKIDSAEICLNKAENMLQSTKDSLSYFHAKYYLNSKKGELKQALNDYERYNDLISTIVTNSLKQSVITAQNENLTSRVKIREANIETIKLRNQVYLLISVCSVIALIVTLVIVFRYIKRKREYVQSLMAEASRIKDFNNRNIEQTNKMREDIIGLIRSKVEMIDEMCNIYIDSQVSDKMKQSLPSRVKSVVTSLKSDEIVSNLEIIINRYHSNIIAEIREKMPDLNETDIKLIIFMLSGFSTQSISLIFDLQNKSIYNKRYRLKQKISVGLNRAFDFDAN